MPKAAPPFARKTIRKPIRKTPRKTSILPPSVVLPNRRTAKPPSLLELGRAASALRVKHSQLDIARMLGVTDSTVGDSLLLVEASAPSVLAAVEAGMLAPTTAVMLVRAAPEVEKQASYLEEAVRRARRRNRRLRGTHEPVFHEVSAKHFTIPLSSRRLRLHTAAVNNFKQLLESLPPTPESTERRATARMVVSFLDGTCSATELARYLTNRKTS